MGDSRRSPRIDNAEEYVSTLLAQETGWIQPDRPTSMSLSSSDGPSSKHKWAYIIPIPSSESPEPNIGRNPKPIGTTHYSPSPASDSDVTTVSEAHALPQAAPRPQLIEGPSLESPMAANKDFAKPTGRVNHSYILPNGETVTSGKGLGRGRPGIKRGPRKLGSNKSTPAKSTLGKRNRSDTEPKNRRARRSLVFPVSDDESSDEYAPQSTQTRSGRHTQRPPQYIPPESPSQKSPHLSSPTLPTTTKPQIKRKIHQRNALCEHCSRGWGPPKNLIVFCDSCNGCWHQRCHDPQIPRKIVTDAASEWFCSQCAEVMGLDKLSAKAAAGKKKATAIQDEQPQMTENSNPRPVEGVRRIFFQDLPKTELVDLLMQASTQAPDLPVWKIFGLEIAVFADEMFTRNEAQSKPATQPKPQSKPTKPSTSTSTSTPHQPPPNPPAEEPIDNDMDTYDDLFDEHARLYPKPGHGVHLPPESEDLNMLLEGRDSRTFSHSLAEGMVGVGMGISGGRGAGRVSVMA